MKLQICLALCAVASLVQGRPRSFNVQSGEGRIIKGTLATSCPYIVYFEACSASGCWSCGASIINADYVITAAHCVVDTSPLTSSQIRAGSLKASSGGQIRQVNINNIWIHPTYVPSTNGGVDIAVCRLATPLTLSDTVKPIPLATQAPAVGQMLRITGWGGTVPYADGQLVNQITSDGLLEAQVPVSRVTDRVVYTGFLGTSGIVADTCQGDSGGPLALASTSSPVGYVLVATVSSGPGCGQGGTESLNMNVATYVATIIAQSGGGAFVQTPTPSKSRSASRSRSPSPKSTSTSVSASRSRSPVLPSASPSRKPSPKGPTPSPSRRASTSQRPSPKSPLASPRGITPSPRPSVDICSSTTVLTVTSTPGYLSRGPYGINENCWMQLQAPAGRTIVIDILFLSTESGFDYVDFYNLNSAGTYTLFYSASGSSPLTQISSSSNIVEVDWYSDTSKTGNGWMIAFTLAPASRSQVTGTGAPGTPLSPIGGTAAELDARRFVIADVEVQHSASSMTSTLILSLIAFTVALGLAYQRRQRVYTAGNSDGDSQLMIEMPTAAPCIHLDLSPAMISPLESPDVSCVSHEEIVV